MNAQPSETINDTPAFLVVERGPNPGQEFSLEQSIASIGRSADNDIVLNDPEVSRHHARIVRQGSIFSLEDLGSTNGTYLNSQRLTGPTPLADGDIVGFGETIRTRFSRHSQAEPPPMPAWEEPAAGLEVPLPPTAVPAAPETPPAARSPRNALLIGLIALLLACCFCGLLILALDSYNQGQLLYCGGLRPFWELILGPFSFNPICP